MKQLAVKTHRTREESQRISDPRSVQAKLFLIGTFAVAFAVLFVPPISEEFGEWNNIRPSAAITKDAWQVYYGRAQGPCAYDASESKGCPANPKNPMLWKSEHHRSDREHVARMREMLGKEFWIGTTIPVDQLDRARQSRASHLILGTIMGNYRIWLDGKYVLGSNPKEGGIVILQIPRERLGTGMPLQLAIQIYHDIGGAFPDIMNSGIIKEGLYDAKNTSAYMSLRSFITKTRPISLFLANFLVATLFILFWFSARTKQEYFYMAIYALIGAMYQLQLVDLINLRVDGAIWPFVKDGTVFFQGCFAMLLGLSFARVRRAVFQWALILCLLAPFAFLASATDMRFALFAVRESLAKYVVPSLCTIGMLSCFLQAAYLFSIKNTGSYNPIRIQRLVGFGLGLSGIAALFISTAYGFSSSHYVSWHFYGHLILVFFLGIIAFSEYQERERLLEKTPVSEYHRRPVLPAKISGAMLVADLKTSEPFYRLRAEHGDNQNPVSIWRSHFYIAILKFGGSVIHKKGDEVIGFFDADQCATPALNALKATDEMSRVSALLEVEFKRQNLYPDDAKGLHFRAAVTTGDIRPVWENMGGVREAYWEEAGTTSVFVESSRLLELERKVGTKPEESALIIPQRLVDGILKLDPALEAGIALRNLIYNDKHGTPYQISVYLPEIKQLQADPKRAA